jgi:hypothetical protein
MATNKNPVVTGAQKVSESAKHVIKRVGSKGRWLGLGALLVVVVVAAAVFARNRLPHMASLDAMRQKVSLAPTLADLQKAVRQNPQDGKAHVALAQAYFDKGMRRQAVAEDDRALILDPRLSSDEMAADLVATFGTPDQPAAANTLATYRVVQATDGLEKLTSSKVYTTRTAALGTLQKLDRASHGDYLRVWTLDLDHPDCEVRRHAISKLGELGDRRAVAPIQAARVKDDQNTPWYGFRCIGNRSEDAEKHILAQQMSKAAPKALAHR